MIFSDSVSARVKQEAFWQASPAVVYQVQPNLYELNFAPAEFVEPLQERLEADSIVKKEVIPES